MTETMENIEEKNSICQRNFILAQSGTGKSIIGEFYPTQKEYEAFSILMAVHQGKDKFTRYFKNENEQPEPICSSMIMQRLETKLIVEKIEHTRKISEPQLYKWGSNAEYW